ncbi:MAG: DUF4349 domain-containing protein [Fibrobacteres bacterium]|nr:DUF4349 domain-containing protein [Fibrobacterota bacterium]
MRRNLRTAAFVAVSLLWGCAGSAKESASPPPPPAYRANSFKGGARAMPSPVISLGAADLDYARAEEAILMDKGTSAAAEFEGSAPPPPSPAPIVAGIGQKPTSSGTPAVSARMIAYQGWIQLASLEPEALLDSAERRVVALDGYVESRRGRHLVLRVPVHRFEQLFQSVKTLGKVISSRKSAEDVTEAVESTDLELQLRRTQLSKLKSILQRETKINERASLLQEIRRVSEEIARLEARSALLRKRVQLSTLELDAVPLQTPTARKVVPPASMYWISSLFNESNPGRIHWDAKANPLGETPEFVSTTAKGSEDPVWQAASADGSVVASFSVANRPLGDARFWRSAISHYRGEEFLAADTSSVAQWSVARLPPVQPDGAVWWIAVRANDKRLEVVQARMSVASDRQLGPAFRRMLQESKP